VVVKHEDVQLRFSSLSAFLDERMRRLVAAAESEAIGYGGVSAVARATGVSRRAITAGRRELRQREGSRESVPAQSRIRRKGAGRKRTVDKDPALRQDLDRLVDPTTRGDPESPLRWTSKSVRKLAEELRREGHAVSYQTVAELLHEMGYSLQANQKTLEGSRHADRKSAVCIHQPQGPALSQAGRAGDFGRHQKEGIWWAISRIPGANGNRKANPSKFAFTTSKSVSRTTVRSLPAESTSWDANVGWVSVGVDHDTAEFAVESIRRWWRWMGRRSYPKAKRVLITADSGGSNGARVRLWKWNCSDWRTKQGLEISVCLFPPGTSRWNKIEHRLFSFISQNWRGKPLISRQVIIDLIAATTTTKGLTVKSKLDTNIYERGLKVSDQQMAETPNSERKVFMAIGTISSYPEVDILIFLISP